MTDGPTPDDVRRAELVAQLGRIEEIEKRKAEDSLHFFLRLMWPQIEPTRGFKDNWHLGFLCEHLQALHSRQIENLGINIPPSTAKSVTCSVAFPAWAWAKTGGQDRFMCISYDQGLSSRDNVRMRGVVESPEYQRLWPIALADDQNTKTRYNTTGGGWRIGTSVGGRIVGEHPTGKIIDDPHNTKRKLLTEQDISDATEMWDYGLGTRGAMVGAWSLLIMQRLHERDLTGHVMSRDDGSWTWIVLPMKYEPPAWVDLGGGRKELRPRMKPTPLGKADPRTEAGELLWPTEWTARKVKSTIDMALGTWGEAGQFQQRPAPATGLKFQPGWFALIDRLPDQADVVATCRFWDVAGTEGGAGARTAGVKVDRLRDDRFVISNIKKGRWSDATVDGEIRETGKLDGRRVLIREEQEPGSSGKAVINARKRSLVGFDYDGRLASGDKVTRATPLCVAAESGRVMIYAGAEDDVAQREVVREFLQEAETFPLGATKDQIDAAAGAFNELTAADVGEWGLVGAAPNPEVIAAADDEIARLERELGLRP